MRASCIRALIRSDRHADKSIEPTSTIMDSTRLYISGCLPLLGDPDKMNHRFDHDPSPLTESEHLTSTGHDDIPHARQAFQARELAAAKCLSEHSVSMTIV